MTTPSESPRTSSECSDSRHTLIALIPFLIAVPGLILAVILWWSPTLPRESRAIAFGIVGAILVFDLPVCILVAIQWLADGKPPELSLSPLIPCREEREFCRQLRERPKLNDDAFYDNFYADSAIPKDLVIRLRSLLEEQFGLDFGGLHPSDNLFYADVELDWYYLFEEIKDEFNLVVPNEPPRTLDGTFDSLLRCVAAAHAGPRSGRP